jgi:hypothetical protein
LANERNICNTLLIDILQRIKQIGACMLFISQRYAIFLQKQSLPLQHTSDNKTHKRLKGDYFGTKKKQIATYPNCYRSYHCHWRIGMDDAW